MKTKRVNLRNSIAMGMLFLAVAYPAAAEPAGCWRFLDATFSADALDAFILPAEQEGFTFKSDGGSGWIQSELTEPCANHFSEHGPHTHTRSFTWALSLPDRLLPGRELEVRATVSERGHVGCGYHNCVGSLSWDPTGLDRGSSSPRSVGSQFFDDQGNNAGGGLEVWDDSSLSGRGTLTIPEGVQDGERFSLRFAMYMGGIYDYRYEWDASGVKPAAAPVPPSAPRSSPTPQAAPVPPSESPAPPAPASQRIDSGARFNSLTGQVEICPDPEEAEWAPCTPRTVIRVGDHIRTGRGSSTIIQFGDMSTFVMRADTEIIVETPPAQQTKLGLVLGRRWTNTKRM